MEGERRKIKIKMFIKTVLTKDKSDYESEVDGLTD
jgi:hypothetical protein